MLANTDRAPSSDLTITGNPAAADEMPGHDDGLHPPFAAARAAALLTEVEQQEEDTNAVVSPTHKDFVLSWIGSAFVALPIAVPYVVLTQILHAIASINGTEEGLGSLMRISNFCSIVGIAICSIGCAVSHRRITGTGAGRGQLAALGAGEIRISTRARRSLGRAHVVLCAFAVVWLIMSLAYFRVVFLVGTTSPVTGQIVTVEYALLMFVGGVIVLNVPLYFLSWWLTLKSACTLVADAIAETKQTIERCSPTSPQWEATVLPSVLDLCDETLPLLSRYGPGVGTQFLGWWLAAAASFMTILADKNHHGASWYMALVCVMQVMFPVGLTYDAASVSSGCDLLSNALNKKRKRGDPNDQDFEHAISRVEKILNNENTKQGLGFTVGNRVVNLKTLGNILAAIAGFASTAVPILFSLRPSAAKIGDEVCGLGPALVAAIQADVAGMGNETCSYNMTIDEVLGM